MGVPDAGAGGDRAGAVQGESADDGSGEEVDALWGKDQEQKLEHHEGQVRIPTVRCFWCVACLLISRGGRARGYTMAQQISVVVLYGCCPVQFCCFCLSLAAARGGGVMRMLYIAVCCTVVSCYHRAQVRIL